MRRRLGSIGFLVGIVLLAGCADEAPTRAGRIDSVTAVEDGTHVTVQAAGCFEDAHVQVGETGDAVSLLWLGRPIDCGDREVGFLESVDVRLEQPLGDRTIIDLGCQVVVPDEPCTMQLEGR